MNLDEISRLVEKSLSGLQVDPLTCRSDKPGKWTVRIKDSEVWIDAFSFDANPHRFYLQIMSPLFKMTEFNQSDIQNDLLEFAYTMYGCSVCKRESWYFAMVLREANGLDQSEVDATIDRVGLYSSDIYAKFKKKFPNAIA